MGKPGNLLRVRLCQPVSLWFQSAFLVGVLGLLTPWAQAQNQSQDLEQLRKAVARFLESHYTEMGARKIAVQVKRLDPRLKLAQCQEKLALSLNDATGTGGNVSVHSRCPGARPWSIYVPAQVDIYLPVAVASRNLSRGTRVTRADMKMELKNTSLLRHGFVDSGEAVVGMELRRPLKRGEPFRARVLVEPLAVKRGEEVRLEARAGAINVSTRGTAMSNGRVGEQIQVKNKHSERVVTGTIVAPGQVETL